MLLVSLVLFDLLLYDLEKKGSDNIHHEPHKSVAHLMLEYLQHRKSLSSDEVIRLESLQKGYKGEMKFHHLVTDVNTTGQFLFDLLFSNQGTEFQIDGLHIDNNTLTMYEIKNFGGDYFMNQDKWYLANNKQEIRNPLVQLQRSEFLLRDLLKQKYPNLIIKAYLVFIHESFMLYQVPLGYPAIFPSQLNRFQRSIQTNRKTISEQTEQIANSLTSLDIGESQYAKYPTYTFDELRKGIICSLDCGSFLQKHKNKLLHCAICDKTADIPTTLARAIAEFQLLFPERKITTGNLLDWCDNTISRSTLKNFLSSNFTMIKNGKYTYYLPKKCNI